MTDELKERVKALAIQHLRRSANGHIGDDFEIMEFAQVVARDCADIAGNEWLTMNRTKDAHERLSPEPFSHLRFGFDASALDQSAKAYDAIRDRYGLEA